MKGKSPGKYNTWLRWSYLYPLVSCYIIFVYSISVGDLINKLNYFHWIELKVGTRQECIVIIHVSIKNSIYLKLYYEYFAVDLYYQGCNYNNYNNKVEYESFVASLASGLRLYMKLISYSWDVPEYRFSTSILVILSTKLLLRIGASEWVIKDMTNIINWVLLVG